MKKKAMVYIFALLLCSFVAFLPSDVYAYSTRSNNVETKPVNAAWQYVEVLRNEVTNKFEAPKSNEIYSALIEEAEKYLGYPYVWGGSNPSTSFDCSGFVCWVLNQSGVASVGRITAQELYNLCTPVSQSEAKPGDLIFFTGTYPTTDDVTHVGFYTGNGKMLHCGNPVQYTSIYTSYWQSHFFAFGQIKQ